MKQKNKTGQLVAICFLILATAAFGLWGSGFSFFSNSKQWRYEKAVINKGNDTNQNPDIIKLTDSCYRMYSHGEGGPGNENLPHSIFSHSSCDGVNWKFDGEVIKKAAMPAAIVTPDNKIRIYFQRSVDNDQKQALVTAISNDGLNFSHEQILLKTDEGELKNIKAIAHFELVKFDKGYRLYFDETGSSPKAFGKHEDQNWDWPVTRIRSLYSEDGLKWTLEPGIRIDYEQEPLTLMQRAGSCTVIKEGSLYHMFFNAGFSPWENTKWWKRLSWSGIYEATSTDGLNWQIIDKSLFSTGSDPKVIAINNQLKAYISEGERGESNSIESYVRTKTQ